MTKRSVTLISTAIMTLLLTVAPSAVLSQDQKQEPVVTQQEKPAPEKAPQKPGETAPVPGQLSIPEGQPQQPAQAIVPAEGGAAEPSAAQASPAGKGNYIVKQGDTLWDISNTFLKDPFLWPFIWKANPSIVNPDLIYPGTELAMPSLAPVERAMQEPAVDQELKELPAEKPAEVKPEEKAEAKPAEEATGKLILPEEVPVPLMDKYAMLNAGFINQDETKDRIIGSKEEKTYMSYDDIAFIALPSRKGAVPGEKFLIFTPLGKVKHPVTGKTYGKLIKVLGIVELTDAPTKPKTKSKSKSDVKAKPAPLVYTGRITLSFDGIGIGSMLTPYQEPSLIYDNQLQQKTKDISGYILEVVDTRTLNATTDVVYLDKGRAEGVEPGDKFLVYGKPEKRAFPRPLIAETQVFLVKEHTSTAVVRRSSNNLEKGNSIEFKK